eukprot:483737_1
MPRKKPTQVNFTTPAPSFNEYDEQIIPFEETREKFPHMKLRIWRKRPRRSHEIYVLNTWVCRNKVSENCKLNVGQRMTRAQLVDLDEGEHHKLHLQKQNKNMYKKCTKFIFKENNEVLDDKQRPRFEYKNDHKEG